MGVMLWLSQYLKPVVAAACLTIAIFVGSQLVAQDLNKMLQELAEAEPEEARALADKIRFQWSQSGSAVVDLLLQRGEEALEAGETMLAIDHFTALTDHAPDFAEGWHGRARTYFAANMIGPAVADLGKALALNPQHFDALRGLGAIFESLNKPEDAYKTYLLVRSIHPHHSDLSEAILRLEPLVNGQTL